MLLIGLCMRSSGLILVFELQSPWSALWFPCRVCGAARPVHRLSLRSHVASTGQMGQGAYPGQQSDPSSPPSCPLSASCSRTGAVCHWISALYTRRKSLVIGCAISVAPYACNSLCRCII